MSRLSDTIILDSNVISRLANPSPRGKEVPIKRFYESTVAEYKSWRYLDTIDKELKDMNIRSGKQELYFHVQKFLAANNVKKLAENERSQSILESTIIQDNLPIERDSDYGDRQIAAVAMAYNYPILSHDKKFANIAKSVEGLVIISWFTTPRKGKKTLEMVRTGRDKETR